MIKKTSLTLSLCLKTFSFLVVIFFVISCSGQNQKRPVSSEIKTKENNLIIHENGFSCGFLDSEGVLWFGSNGGGVYRYDGTVFVNFTKEDGLSNNQVCSITEDKQGNLWFGTAKGLCRYDRKTFTTIAIPQSDTSTVWLDKVYPIVNPNQVMSILQDRNGIFWIGTNGAGVYRYDGTAFIQYLSNVGKYYEDSLQHNIVLSITEDLSGNIWFTSLSHAGVSRYDALQNDEIGQGVTFTHFKTENGLSDNFVRTSFCDKEGNIWIGTHGNRNGGLDRFDGKKFTNFRKTDDGLAQNNVMSIYEDKLNNLWLGGGRGNLAIFDGKHFEEFTTKEGRKFELILFIVEDAKGDIWFGGRNGIWHFDGETVKDMIQN